MPEQISKYPRVTIEVFKGAGAHCGEGAEQTILTQCLKERFCALSTGEACIYGVVGKLLVYTEKQAAEGSCLTITASRMLSPNERCLGATYTPVSHPFVERLIGTVRGESRPGVVLGHD